MNRRLRPHGTHSQRPTQQGMALLEVLVSLLLFSFGILGLIGLQAKAVTLSVDADDRNRAALLANEVASWMWLNKTTVLDAATLTKYQTRANANATQTDFLGVAQNQLPGLPNGQLAVNAITTNSADITITWSSPQRAIGETSRLYTRVTLPPS